MQKDAMSFRCVFKFRSEENKLARLPIYGLNADPLSYVRTNIIVTQTQGKSFSYYPALVARSTYFPRRSVQ